ncbi:unnamed protein product, partial [Rotaria sordida]
IGCKHSHSAALSQIQSVGIGISSSGGCSNCNNPKCTSLDQVNCNAIRCLRTLKTSSGCPITVTGGTETGHASGTHSHWNGYKIDISLNSCIDSYITKQFAYIGKRGDGATQYKASSGNVYAKEGNHWDITFTAQFITIVNSSHFLGGTINWCIENSSTNSTWVAILITQTYSWTYTPGKYDHGEIAAHQVVAGTGGILTCSPSCPTGFGSVSTTPYCTDVSSLNGTAVGQRSDVVVIPEGSDFSVIYASSAWGSLTLGGAGWSISSHIKLNKTTLITTSVSDADGDIVRCRWATSSNGVDECGSVCPPHSLPANTVIYSNCTIEVIGTIAGSRYAIAIMVTEDFINSTSTTPLSSVPVQFLLEVVTPSSCSILPEVSLTGKSCTPIKVNETFTSQLLGINHCGENVTIIDISTLSFSGMIQESLAKLSSLIYYKNITWTPTIYQLGYQVMCAMGLNSQHVQSLQHCFTFYVTENGTDTCPGVIDHSTTTISSISTSTTLMTTTNTSTSTQILTSSCINWLLVASLAALALRTTACNCCLLCHWYKGYKNKRQHKLDKYDSSKTSMSLISISKTSFTVMPIDTVYSISNENMHKSNIDETRLNHTKETTKPNIHIIVHIHGGGWVRGSHTNKWHGSLTIGRTCAREGFVSIIVSYRLAHADPNQIFLSGYSAGAHLISLLVLDKSHLHRHEFPLSIICDVITISGIYSLANSTHD